MINLLLAFFDRKKISNYRIIEHIFEEYTLNITSEHIYNGSQKEKKIYLILVEIDSKTKRLELPICNEFNLDVILNSWLVDDLFWIHDKINLSELISSREIGIDISKSIAEYQAEIENQLITYLHLKNFTLIEARNMFIKHKTNVYNNKLMKTQIHNEFNSLLYIHNEINETKHLFGSSKNIGDIFDEFSKNDNVVYENKIDYRENELIGNVNIPTHIMEILYKIIVSGLSGQLISSGRSFVKSEDFGLKVASSMLTISDRPSYYLGDSINFDAEGTKIEDKYLIKEGILLDCLNDLESATLLNLKPGNLFYDYVIGRPIIKESKIVININKEIDIKDIDIEVEKIYNNKLNYNFLTGFLDLEVLGTEIKTNQMYIYKLNIELISLIKRIVGKYGEDVETSKYILSDTVFKL